VVADGLISARFRLAELLGTGGTASVFAAVDVRDDSEVALKILHPHLAADEGAREALFREARAAAGLRHANIVTVLDTGVHDDSLAWISLELVAGTSLSEFVEVRGPLDVDQAVTLARGILLALEAAHAAGIVHRDVSPANVMIATRPGERIVVGDVRLVDFGLADATGRPALSAGGDDAPAGVVGNVNYLSPEQAEGREIDARGDVYQLGAVLYFALTGRAPFERSTVVETMRAHVSSPPPVPSVRRSGVPRALDRLVVKAMLKQPRDRFQSAGEMLAAIDALAPVAGEFEPRTMLLGAPTSTVARGAPATRTAVPRDATTRLGVVGPSRGPAARPVRPGRTTSGAAVATAVGASPVAPPTPEPRSPAWAIVGAIVVIAAAVAWILSATTVAPPRAADAASVATPAAPATPTPTRAAAQQPQVTTVAVPDVAGGTVVSAAVLLDRAGLTLGTTAEENSPAPAGTILRTSPEAASQQRPGTAVTLVVANGSNTVPALAGLTRDAAAAALREAGFTALFEDEVDLMTPEGIVLKSDPADATSIPLGGEVRVIVATPPPAAAPTTTPAPGPTGAPAPSSGG